MEFSVAQAWEMLAVALALVYLLLALREHIACWLAAFASTAIYVYLFWDASLLMESALQIYYLAMAVYGYYCWRRRPTTDATKAVDALFISSWRWWQHLLALALLVLATLVTGQLLQQHTQAALPYLDSFTSWAAVVTTFMVTRKILENWLYWIVIDALSIYIYIERGLFLTAGLFLLYTIIAVFGYFTWRKRMLAYENADGVAAEA